MPYKKPIPSKDEAPVKTASNAADAKSVDEIIGSAKSGTVQNPTKQNQDQPDAAPIAPAAPIINSASIIAPTRPQYSSYGYQREPAVTVEVSGIVFNSVS